MPNNNSAKKRLRQSIDRRARNRAGRSSLRTQLKKVRSAVAAGDVQAAETAFGQLQKSLDRAGSARLIHPNASARLKARTVARIKALKAGAAA